MTLDGKKVEAVELIPWNPSDEQHYERMYVQRVNCGWRKDEVPEWKRKHLEGIKFVYWIAIAENFPGREKHMADHLGRYPEEKEPIQDSAAALGKYPRTPTQKSFIPVGQIALNIDLEGNAKFALPEGTLWITSLYISWALQSGGFGRSAMAQTERVAASAPHNAGMVALDTMRKEYQLQESHLRTLYEERGLQRPETVFSNEEWYIRQGYEVMPTKEEVYYVWTVEQTGEKRPMPCVFMKKLLAASG